MSAAPTRTAELLAHDLRGTSSAADLITWAVEALCDGFDCESLRRLAGLDVARRRHELGAFEASQEFRKALGEMGLAIPNVEDALRAYARALASDLLKGKLTPQHAVEIMNREVLRPLNYPRDLMAWCDLGEGIDPATGPLSSDELEQAVRYQAEVLLGLTPDSDVR